MKPVFKKCIIILSTIVGLFLLLFIIYSPVIFQEGNPLPELRGIISLTFKQNDLVQISVNPTVYMTKSSDGKKIIINFMKSRGSGFKEQMGSGYMFENPDGKKIMIIHRQYSRFYSLWKFSEDAEKVITYNISAELADCLPKSNTLSHEKCLRLLAQIQNFNDCIYAGFNIMKSNPPQCATPDGRTFTQETNSSWEMAVSAIQNCEVKSASQTHSLLVTLELKNGNNLTANEPEIDDIVNLVREAEPICGRIMTATE